LWVQFGEKIHPEEGRFLQMDSAKEPAVGNLLPFDKEIVCADFARLRDDVAQVEGTNGWISDRTSNIVLVVHSKSWQGINIDPGCM
jgi:hypothetical protein